MRTVATVLYYPFIFNKALQQVITTEEAHNGCYVTLLNRDTRLHNRLSKDACTAPMSKASYGIATAAKSTVTASERATTLGLAKQQRFATEQASPRDRERPTATHIEWPR